MRTDPDYRKITVDEFLAIDFGTDKKFELVDGMIRMMTGGTVRHSRVATNALAFLRNRLRGSGCVTFNSDMGVRVGDTDVRYPDVSVFCGAALEGGDDRKVLESPVVIIEVLSPSTSANDQGVKLGQYRAIASVDTIVLVDPVNELARTLQRLSATSWRDDMFAQPHDIALPALGVTIPHDEMFARD